MFIIQLTLTVFDEISSDRKLQYLLTDVKISNESRVSSIVRIKLTTGACGNLLPFNIYKNIHPQVSVKDLHKTIDKRVCLEAYKKSEIKPDCGTWQKYQVMSFLHSTRLL